MRCKEYLHSSDCIYWLDECQVRYVDTLTETWYLLYWTGLLFALSAIYNS